MTTSALASTKPRLAIPDKELAEFCRRNHIRRLALFGSVLRDDFQPDSDVDVLVDFEAGARIGMFALTEMQYELSDLLRQPVYLVLRDGLKPIIRDSVLSSSNEVYAV